MKEYIPKTKDDLQAIEHLNHCSFSEVSADVPVLLEFMQDLHWEVAHGIGVYFAPYVNEIKKDLLQILLSNDNEWKFGILFGLVAKSSVRLDKELIEELRRISISPTAGEVQEELNTVAKEILANNDMRSS